MDRPIFYALQQVRTFDWLTAFREMLYGFGLSVEHLLGSTGTVVSGLSATPSSGLTIAFTAGGIYQAATLDTTAYSTVGTDSRVVMQQGVCAAQTVTLVTSGLSSGQSQYALVQAAYNSVDEIPSDDPNSGIIEYYNADDAVHSLVGPNGSGTAEATRRSGKCTLSVKYGTAATSGAEVAPSADAGYTPLYLIDLSYGQTSLTSSQIKTHTSAPFLAGLLASHHGGDAGQAPKIQLPSEVTGELPDDCLPMIPAAKLPKIPLSLLPDIPLSYLPASSDNSGGGLSTIYCYAGNPNGSVAGSAGVDNTSAPDMCWDLTNKILYLCTVTGEASAAKWVAINPVTYPTVYVKTRTGSLSVSAVLVSATVSSLPAGTYRVRFSSSVAVTEATYGFQIFWNGTAITGAYSKLTVSSGGSSDSMTAPVELEGFLTITTARSVTFSVNYGVTSGSGSLSDIGGGAITIEPINAISMT